MTIYEAVHSVLGGAAAHGIIADLGLHWAVIAAMCAAEKGRDDEAVAVIRKWNAEQKARPIHSGEDTTPCDV